MLYFIIYYKIIYYYAILNISPIGDAKINIQLKMRIKL